MSIRIHFIPELQSVYIDGDILYKIVRDEENSCEVRMIFTNIT